LKVRRFDDVETTECSAVRQLMMISKAEIKSTVAEIGETSVYMLKKAIPESTLS
jgi:hypothetical protein